MLVCKKCDRSFRHLTAICPNCGRKLVEQTALVSRVTQRVAPPSRISRSAPARSGYEPLPPLPKALRPREESAVPFLETPDYLGAEPHFHGRDDPMVSESWEKSPRLDPSQVGLPQAETQPTTAVGWVAIAIGVVIGVLGGGD